MFPVNPISNCKSLFTNFLGSIPIHEGFMKSVLDECIQKQIKETANPFPNTMNPTRIDTKPVEEFFIGSPNKRASLHTEKAPSSPRTFILKGPSGNLHTKGRERSRRRLYAQHRRAAELDAKHEKEMKEFHVRLEESTRCCRDLRSHLEREADYLERRERMHRQGLELRKAREDQEIRHCTFKPTKPTPVPASNKPTSPKTKEHRLCRQLKAPTPTGRKPKCPKKEKVIDESTTDESNTSSVATIRWVRPTLSFAATATMNT